MTTIGSPGGGSDRSPPDERRLSALRSADKVEAAIDRCISQAQGFVESAEHIIGVDGLHHVAFANLVLAFEELGKAGMIGVASVFATLDEERALKLMRDTEDHERKLFWAFWGPGASRSTKTDVEQIPEFQLVAARMHDARMAATYVTLEDEGTPATSVDMAFVRRTLDLLKVQVELAKMAKPRQLSDADASLFDWFLDATKDPARAKLIFGSASIKKRSELGDPESWIKWLKALFDEADQAARDLTARELARSPADLGDGSKSRWKIRIRLESASHSIRAKAFDVWNKASAHVKFTADHNHKGKRALFVDIDLPDSIPGSSVWHAGLEYANHIIIALNIGSFGFFWWSTGPRTTRYYEKIVDAENSMSELVVEPVGAPVMNYGPNAFTSREMDSVTRAFIGLVQAGHQPWRPVLSAYLDGLRISARVDIHLRVEASALAAFARAFREAVALSGVPPEEPGAAAEKLLRLFGTADGDEARTAQLVTWATTADPATFRESGITLRDVMIVKTLADAVMLQAAEAGLRALAERENAKKKGAGREDASSATDDSKQE